MISLQIILAAAILAVALAAPPTSPPPTRPSAIASDFFGVFSFRKPLKQISIPLDKPKDERPSSPIASDFFGLSMRKPVKKTLLSFDERYTDDSMIKYVTCVPNLLNHLVIDYACKDIWEIHIPYYLDALEQFAQCSLFQNDDEYDICQYQNFHMVTRIVSIFYMDLKTKSSQAAYDEIPSIVEKECKPDDLRFNINL